MCRDISVLAEAVPAASVETVPKAVAPGMRTTGAAAGPAASVTSKQSSGSAGWRGQPPGGCRVVANGSQMPSEGVLHRLRDRLLKLGRWKRLRGNHLVA